MLPSGSLANTTKKSAAADVSASTESSDEDSSDEILATRQSTDSASVTGSPTGKSERRQKELQSPNCRVSPLDIRFSQLRARNEFRDGRSIDFAVESIEVIRCEEEENAGGPRVWRLDAQFPHIEVLPWRCKLRDENGRPMVDANTGGEMWDNEDHVFSLDNRRLIAYQKVAARLWPDRAVIDVIKLPPQSLTRMRQLRKFRTMDCGESIALGSRVEGSELTRWSWREAAGVEEPRVRSASSLVSTTSNGSGGNGGVVQMRRRPRQEHRNGARQMKNQQQYQQPRGQKQTSQKTESNGNFLRGLLTFLIIYFSVRVIKEVIAQQFFATPNEQIQGIVDTIPPSIQNRSMQEAKSNFASVACAQGIDGCTNATNLDIGDEGDLLKLTEAAPALSSSPVASSLR